MVKSSKKTLLQDEIKVLDVLKQNSEENIDEIAKSCGFSRQKVWRIIKNLEKKKIIWGYTAVSDEEAYGFKHFILLITRSNEPLRESHKKELVFEKVDKYLSGMVKVDDIYYTNGKFDLVITFFSQDIINAKKFAQEIFDKNKNLFRDYTILQTLFPIRMKSIKNPQIKKLVEYT
jgi:DNA-binding Lrp family transcriptional regulator